jgi:hypothetical protein
MAPGVTRRLLGVALCGLLAGCGEPAAEPPATPSGAGAAASDGGAASLTYEQSFVFARVSADSVFLVPWLMRTTVLPDTVVREARGWLERSGIWDAFFSATWATPPTRAPSRILPYGSLRLLVQEGDLVDGIIYEEGARRLEIALGDVRASWGGPRGEAIELLDGAAYLSEERFEGIVVHIARGSSGAAPPGGDWAVLASGDSVVLVLAADDEHGRAGEPVYRAWGDLGDDERVWTEVAVAWTATQAFPPARRDVPVRWRITTASRQLQGELRTASADIEAGNGPGPLLPVRALNEVTGEVVIEGTRYPVRGLLVHERR